MNVLVVTVVTLQRYYKFEHRRTLAKQALMSIVENVLEPDYTLFMMSKRLLCAQKTEERKTILLFTDV